MPPLLNSLLSALSFRAAAESSRTKMNIIRCRSVFVLFLSVFLHKRLFDAIQSPIQSSCIAFIANALGLDRPMSLLIIVYVSAAQVGTSRTWAREYCDNK